MTTIIYSVSYIQKNQSCMFKQIICDRVHDEVCYVHDSYLKKNFVASVRFLFIFDRKNGSPFLSLASVAGDIIVSALR